METRAPQSLQPNARRQALAEFSPLASMDEEDEAEYGIVLCELKPPGWEDENDQKFEYLGTY